MAEHDGLFAILLDIDNHLLIVVHRIVFALGSILRHRDGREEFLDFLLHLIHIDVAHHNDGLQVRAIPLVIVVAQVLVGKVIDDIHRTDGHAVLILGALIHLGHGLLHQPLYGTSGTALAPLFMNHAALLVNFLVFQQQVVAPVMQNEQTRVDDAVALQGNCRDIVNRLFYTGIGIEVGAELDTDSLTPRHNAQLLTLAREMLRTIKSHVFQEVSQSALAGFLLDRAYTLGNIEVGHLRVLAIMTQIVGHAVLQLTHAYRGILTQRLSQHTGGNQRHGRKQNQSFIHRNLIIMVAKVQKKHGTTCNIIVFFCNFAP